MMYINAGAPLWAMQIPKKEFEGNSALDKETDQNPLNTRDL